MKETNQEGLDKQIEELRLKKGKLLGEVNALRQMKIVSNRNANFIESEILQSKKIILTTLSMSGIELLDKMEFKYSHLIIDEACQSTEISTLIPFTQDIKKVILVGDQNQLPATVFSDNSEKTKFNRSFYERLLENDIPRFVLKIQYRMCSAIRQFPSNQFYNGEIQDDPRIAKRQVNDRLGNVPKLMFYDLGYTKSTSGKKSKSNEMEADFVAKLFLEAIELKGSGDFYKGLDVVKGEVGVITPYKRQCWLIRDKIEKAIKTKMNQKMNKNQKKDENPQEVQIDINKIVEVNTVDSFQGREKDTIIISCVRASQNSDLGIGFLNDFRRMNVAITRAKNFLWVVGQAKTLVSDKNWKDLIGH
jgi:senataxin